MRSKLITFWAFVTQLALTNAQVPEAKWSVPLSWKSCKSKSLLSNLEFGCCTINFSDTECGQAGAEIDYSVSFPTANMELPVVNLPEPLTSARVVVCGLAQAHIIFCSENNCVGGEAVSVESGLGCISPGFFIRSVQIRY